MNGHQVRSNYTAIHAPDGGLPAGVDPPSARAVYLAATALLLAGYSTVFSVTLGVGASEASRIAICNVLPLSALAFFTWRVLRRHVLNWSVVGQTATHTLLAPLFAFVWYAGTLGALAAGGALRGGPFRVGAFTGQALVWQMFQGIVLYALVASVTYALRGGRGAAQVIILEQAPRLERYLTRAGDELVPIAVDDISVVRGAQDYAEVVTRDGSSHLVRLSLGELEARLPGDRFVRVHRSAIVNLALLVRAEPAGSGRMVLHMPGGPVEVSRTGAQALRQRIL